MNKRILTIASALTLMMIGGGCEYNDNFEGLQEGTVVTDVKRFDYTLTAEDYTTIANNSANKTMASAAGLSSALTAVGTNKYFTAEVSGKEYIPNWLKATYPTADNGSAIKVTYNLAAGMPENVAAMNAMKSYTLTADDYKTVWGSETNYAEAITPATAAKLASVISTEGLEAGDYVAVAYKYSAAEPTFGDEEPGEQPSSEMTSVLGSAELNDAVTVTGYIAAVSKQGPILSDKGGSLLLYGYSQTSELKVGDIVTVTGKIGAYNKGFQIAANDATIEKVGTMSAVTYPEYTELTGAAMDALLASRTDNEYAQFVKITGTIATSGSNVNILVDGAETAQGSIYGITEEMKAAITDGQEVTVYGYFLAIAGSRYLNIVVSHLNEEPAVGEPEPAAPEYTSVLGSAALNDAVTVTGYIAAVSKQGPILSDKGGSLLLYGYSQTSELKVGDVVTVTGKIGAYNKGFQIAANDATIEKVGTTTVTDPTATELTGAAMDALLASRTDNEYAQFVKITGTIAVNGNNVNVVVEGAETAQGSFYGITDEMKAAITDGQQATVYGYFLAIAGGRYLNIVATAVESASATAYGLTTRVATVASEQQYAIFTYNGSSFADAGNTVVQPADFTAMGNTYGSFTDPTQDDYLPKFLAQTYPYASEGDVKYVSFRCYKGGATNWATDEYSYDGSAWVKNDYIETVEDQFVKSNNVWNFDPSVVWVIEAGRNMHPATEFFQACVDWVLDNVADGDKYVTSYGNNDYYSGASAYQGNLDWRASAAKGQYADGFTGMSDDAVTELLQQRTFEVFAGVLPQFYPDLAPIEGIDVTVTVRCTVYTGTSTVYDFVFKTVDKGTFEFVEFKKAE